MSTWEVNRRWQARLTFLEHNPPRPWTCVVCKEPITLTTGHKGQRLVVHHKDEDFTNNDPKNLQAMHLGCHSSFHNKGKPRPKSPAHKAALSKAMKGKPGRVWTPEEKAKVSESMKEAWIVRKS